MGLFLHGMARVGVLAMARAFSQRSLVGAQNRFLFEAIRPIRHQLLALVHGRHHLQLAQPSVPDLPSHQVLGDDPHDLAACAASCVGHLTGTRRRHCQTGMTS